MKCSLCGTKLTRGFTFRAGSGGWQCSECGYFYCDNCKDEHNDKCPRCGSKKLRKADV